MSNAPMPQARKFSEAMKAILESRSDFLVSVFGDERRASKFKSDLLLVGSNPAIARCSPSNVFKLAIEAAASGLSILPQKKETYLVPYGKDVQLQIGYIGWLKLAKLAGYKVNVELIFDIDKFNITMKGMEEEIYYEPDYFNPERREDDSQWVEEHLVGALAIIKEGGEAEAKFISAAILKKIKNQNQSVAKGKFSPWTTWANEMYQAQAIKYVVSKLPMPDQMANVIDLETQSELKANNNGYLEEEKPRFNEPKEAFSFLEEMEVSAEPEQEAVNQ